MCPRVQFTPLVWADIILRNTFFSLETFTDPWLHLYRHSLIKKNLLAFRRHPQIIPSIIIVPGLTWGDLNCPGLVSTHLSFLKKLLRHYAMIYNMKNHQRMHFQCTYENEAQDQDVFVSNLPSQTQVSHNQNNLPSPCPQPLLTLSKAVLATLRRSCAQTPEEELGCV